MTRKLKINHWIYLLTCRIQILCFIQRIVGMNNRIFFQCLTPTICLILLSLLYSSSYQYRRMYFCLTNENVVMMQRNNCKVCSCIFMRRAIVLIAYACDAFLLQKVIFVKVQVYERVIIYFMFNTVVVFSAASKCKLLIKNRECRKVRTAKMNILAFK